MHIELAFQLLISLSFLGARGWDLQIACQEAALCFWLQIISRPEFHVRAAGLWT